MFEFTQVDYSYMVGMSFDEVIADLDAKGFGYDFGGMSYDECVADIEDAVVYIGGLWSDLHYEVEFDKSGRVVSIYLCDEGWD